MMKTFQGTDYLERSDGFFKQSLNLHGAVCGIEREESKYDVMDSKERDEDECGFSKSPRSKDRDNRTKQK